MQSASLSTLLRKNRFSHFCCGSLPFKDPNMALDFIFKRPWILPFWPELPSISPAELMVNRAARVLRESWSGYAPSEALGLYSLRHYLDLRGVKLPILKCQVGGPLTLVEYSRELSENWDDALQVATDICLEQIHWQITFFEGLTERLLFVIDEPALGKWNDLGERCQSRIVDAFSSIYVQVSERNCFLGLHSCCPFDHNILSLPVELYSFDALAKPGLLSAESAQQDWQGAIRRGMVLAPGVFPACPDSDAFEVLLQTGLKQYALLKQALPENPDRTQLLLAANCGHAGSSESWIEYLYGRTAPEITSPLPC